MGRRHCTRLCGIVVVAALAGCHLLPPTDKTPFEVSPTGAYLVFFTDQNGRTGGIGDVAADGEVLSWQAFHGKNLRTAVVGRDSAAFIGGYSPNVYQINRAGIVTKSTLGDAQKPGATTAHIPDADAESYYATQNTGRSETGYQNELIEADLNGNARRSTTVPGFVTSITTTTNYVVTSGEITQNSGGVVVHQKSDLTHVKDVKTVAMPMRCFADHTSTDAILCAENPSQATKTVNDLATVVRRYDLTTGAHNEVGTAPVEIITMIQHAEELLIFTQEELGTFRDGNWVSLLRLGATKTPNHIGHFVKRVQQNGDYVDVFVFRSPYTKVGNKLDAGHITRIDLRTKKEVRKTPVVVPKTGAATMQFLPKEFFASANQQS